MNEIKDLVPAVLIDTANKYALAKEEECRNENEKFKKRIISAVKGCCRDIFMFSIVVTLIIGRIIFLREQPNGK